MREAEEGETRRKEKSGGWRKVEEGKSGGRRRKAEGKKRWMKDEKKALQIFSFMI
jgi:hypothetical protein